VTFKQAYTSDILRLTQKIKKNRTVCCSSPAGDGPATGGGGVFWPGNSIPIPSGGSRCVVWSQRCDTLSTWTDSAAAEDTPRCHSDQRQQRTESASTGVHWHCSSDIGLDVLSPTCRLQLEHQQTL